MILRVAAGRRYLLFAVFASMLSVARAEAHPSIDVIR